MKMKPVGPGGGGSHIAGGMSTRIPQRRPGFDGRGAATGASEPAISDTLPTETLLGDAR